MNSGSKILVLVNPSAGRGRAARARSSVEEFLRGQGAPVDFVEAESADDTRRRAGEAASAGYTHVVALGGDGTFHQILNGAFGSGLLLGLIPAGGGNDIARALDLPLDPVAAAHTLLHAPARAVDLLRVRSTTAPETLYIAAGGLGLDAEAARLANQRFRRVPGIFRYIAAALQAFRQFRPFVLELEVDGVRTKARALLIAVANSPSYGSGVIVAPAAQLDDGWMDLMLVAPLNWTQILDGLMLALRTGDIRWPEITRMRARRVRLAADRPAIFHGDGEILAEAPVEIELLPQAVRVVAPQRKRIER
jgi:YegS/Rv2252/BmrU family lipid kinase